MKTRLFWRGLVTAGLLLIANSCHSANITWVSIVTDEVNGSDVGFTDLLSGFGHTVTRFFSHTDLTATEIDTLNSSDLIIASRAINSGEFDGTNAVVWNEQILVPMIHMSGYATRQNRLGLFTASDIPDSNATPLVAVDPTHRVFHDVAFAADGVTMANPYNIFIDRGTSTPSNTPVLPGTIIARNPSVAGGVAIAEWPAGTQVRDEGGVEMFLANNRYFFAGGSREANGNAVATAGKYDLTTDGLQLFFNLVDYALGGIAPQCDFDGDLLCSINDLNNLLGEGPLNVNVPVVGGVNDQYDLNDDSVLNLLDRDLWLASAATENGRDFPYALGDANLDGAVDQDDFARWAPSRFTETTSWDLGDFNSDGVADGADFNVWNANRSALGQGASTVPEPAGWLLTSLGLFCLRMVGPKRIGRP